MASHAVRRTDAWQSARIWEPLRTVLLPRGRSTALPRSPCACSCNSWPCLSQVVDRVVWALHHPIGKGRERLLTPSQDERPIRRSSQACALNDGDAARDCHHGWRQTGWLAGCAERSRVQAERSASHSGVRLTAVHEKTTENTTSPGG
jgi:hypothetical protein